MIFPNIKAKEIDKLELNNLKEIAWDFDSDCPIIYNNDFVVVSGLDALKVWVYKTLKTTRFVNLVYSNAYGTSIKNFIGKVFTLGTERALKKEIINALMVNKYIDRVNILELKLENTNLDIYLEIMAKNQSLEVRINV